jgi:hypothetical protein
MVLVVEGVVQPVARPVEEEGVTDKGERPPDVHPDVPLRPERLLLCPPLQHLRVQEDADEERPENDEEDAARADEVCFGSVFPPLPYPTRRFVACVDHPAPPRT